jgi:isopentenyldiphosphate isomerase
MQSLSQSDIHDVLEIAASLRFGDALTQADMKRLVSAWTPKLSPGEKDAEVFALAHADGTTTGVMGPRWVFHLFGLRHRAVHVGLATPSELIVLQRRSAVLRDWPGAADMAVAGHVSDDLTFLEAAWKEMKEEIGLSKSTAEQTLVEGRLLPVGVPYVSFDRDLNRNPPFLNAETRQIYAATLTAEGLSRLHFADSEVAGLLLVTPETAWDILANDPIASGLRYSLPRYLDWMDQKKVIGDG